MLIFNSSYFNIYKLLYNTLLLLICLFLTACSAENDTKQILSTENLNQTGKPVVNINSASVEDLEKLPHIGRQTAENIVKQRENFGKFRKPEHLLLIRGISDKKFREIKNLITTE